MAEPERAVDPLEAFIAQFWKDVDRNAVRPLDDYLRLFPGNTEAIAHEYLGLKDRPATAGPVNEGPRPEPMSPAGRAVGPYGIIELLGSGGQGEVLLAEDL